MEIHTTEKIDISRILLYSAPGTASGARVTSMEAANSVLQSWTRDQSGMLPDECEVEIVFEDGLRYRSHFPLKKQEKTVSLGRYVRRQLLALTKVPCTTTDQPAANDAVCHDHQEASARAKEMLEHYNI